MLQNKQNILILIVIALLGYNIFTTNSIRTDVKGYERRIDSVQTKIDSAQVINKQIDVKIDSVKENVISITKETSSTGAAPGYLTPNAFTGGKPNNEKRRKKTAIGSTGYKIVGEPE